MAWLVGAALRPRAPEEKDRADFHDLVVDGLRDGPGYLTVMPASTGSATPVT
jgi:hypothetical protein